MQKTTLIAGLTVLASAAALAAYFVYSGLGAADAKSGGQAQSQSAKLEDGKPDGGKFAGPSPVPGGKPPGIPVKVAQSLLKFRP